jgi:hypothetical protein
MNRSIPALFTICYLLSNNKKKICCTRLENFDLRKDCPKINYYPAGYPGREGVVLLHIPKLKEYGK